MMRILLSTTNQDTAYFSSDKDGNFDIFLLKKPADKDLSSWFSLDYSTPVRADSLNSDGDDKCPFISKISYGFCFRQAGRNGWI